MVWRLCGLASIWTNAGLLSIGPLESNFSEIWSKYSYSHSRKWVWKCRLEIAAILSQPQRSVCQCVYQCSSRPVTISNQCLCSVYIPGAIKLKHWDRMLRVRCKNTQIDQLVSRRIFRMKPKLRVYIVCYNVAFGVPDHHTFRKCTNSHVNGMLYYIIYIWNYIFFLTKLTTA